MAKLRKYFLDDLEVEHIVLHAFRYVIIPVVTALFSHGFHVTCEHMAVVCTRQMAAFAHHAEVCDAVSVPQSPETGSWGLCLMHNDRQAQISNPASCCQPLAAALPQGLLLLCAQLGCQGTELALGLCIGAGTTSR